MNRTNKGFVVSAVLYPLLILFLALIMGLLSMSDTRKRILDKMKLEISDSVFDEATCSCDTILNKLNYIIKNGVAGGGGGSYSQNTLGLNVTAYETPEAIPNVGNNEGDIAVITATEITNYYVSPTPPVSPKEGTTWVVMSSKTGYYISSDYSNIPISYVVQYEDGNWILKRSYVYALNTWKELNYISGDEYTWNYAYTGSYQKFTAPYTGIYKMELWGAAGGITSGTQGKGGYTSGEIYLTSGEELYIYVGQKGITSSTVMWNGGGNGYSSQSGGGATDIRTIATSSATVWNETASLRSRIMVAGGGGGAESGTGGSGGGLFGYGNNAGSQASQLSGDAFGSGGGSGGVDKSGGGGGWYGGYAPTADAVGGGGGSSFISGHTGSMAMNQLGIITGSQFSYTNYYFKNTKMIDGNGYNWTTIKGAYTGMPQISGNNIMIGNTGAGYARISLIDLTYQTENEIEQYRIDSQRVFNYNYRGYYYEFTPLKTATYKIELWGAAGYIQSGTQGRGAYTSGEINLIKGNTIYIYLGSKGIWNTTSLSWNGGGNGYRSSGGGGATDVRTVATAATTTWNETASLRSRIMVAGAGGGAESGTGGAGGGLIGYPNNAGAQATQTSGYAFAIGGGAGGVDKSGAGAGWYGGYAPTADAVGGGGGTSYISGHAGCIGITAAGVSNATEYADISDSYSYTGYKFANTKMIDGRGYEWTTKIGGYTGMPIASPTSTEYVTGNTGDGYARITVLD